MKYPKDRFDDFPNSLHRRGAHRAPRSRWSKLASWLIALASIVLLVGIGVGVMWMIDRQVQFSGSMAGPTETPTETAAATEEATPTETAEPTPTATVDADSTVTVLNGTNIGGLASAGSAALSGDGWSIGDVADADTSDHLTTTIAIASEDARGAALGIVESLGFGEIVVDPAVAGEGEIIVTLGEDAAGLLG